LTCVVEWSKWGTNQKRNPSHPLNDLRFRVSRQVYWPSGEASFWTMISYGAFHIKCHEALLRLGKLTWQVHAFWFWCL
jgi:hypothetical protein